MKPSPKAVLAIAPQSVASSATVTGTVDTLGYDWATLDILQNTSDTTGHKLATCKVSTSDTTDATNYSDVTALVGGGVGGFTIPNANTSVGQVYKLNVDLKKVKRYLKFTITPATTQVLGAVANLHIAEQEPTQAADAGVDVLVNY